MIQDLIKIKRVHKGCIIHWTRLIETMKTHRIFNIEYIYAGLIWIILWNIVQNVQKVRRRKFEIGREMYISSQNQK